MLIDTDVFCLYSIYIYSFSQYMQLSLPSSCLFKWNITENLVQNIIQYRI